MMPTSITIINSATAVMLLLTRKMMTVMKHISPMIIYDNDDFLVKKSIKVYN